MGRKSRRNRQETDDQRTNGRSNRRSDREDPADARDPTTMHAHAVVPDATIPDVGIPDATVPDATIPGAGVPTTGSDHEIQRTPNGTRAATGESTRQGQDLDPLIFRDEVSEAFADRVREIADGLGVEPDHLMAVMAFETGGTFDPAAENAAGSGATGLIQFMPAIAEDLGTTTEDLAEMTAVEQLDYVEAYFEPHTDDLSSLADLYMAVLYPAAVDEPAEYALFEDGTTAYDQNRGLDDDDDGTITKSEAAAKVRDWLERGRAAREEASR